MGLYIRYTVDTLAVINIAIDFDKDRLAEWQRLFRIQDGGCRDALRCRICKSVRKEDLQMCIGCFSFAAWVT